MDGLKIVQVPRTGEILSYAKVIATQKSETRSRTAPYLLAFTSHVFYPHSVSVTFLRLKQDDLSVSKLKMYRSKGFILPCLYFFSFEKLCVILPLPKLSPLGTYFCIGKEKCYNVPICSYCNIYLIRSICYIASVKKMYVLLFTTSWANSDHYVGILRHYVGICPPS